MMTPKQASYIEALFAKKEYDMIPDVVLFTQTYTEAISKELASTVIEYLLSCPDKAQEIKDTAHIKAGLVTLISKKRKNKQATEMKIRPIVGGFLNKATVHDVTPEQLIAMEDILRDAKYIK